MTEPSNLMVVCMGLGTVFFGLICIVIMSSIMSAIIKAIEGNKPIPAPAAAPVGTSAGAIENKQEIVAAVSAVIAEELGTEASNIRIHSFKKVN